jgi:hypothetical protein
MSPLNQRRGDCPCPSIRSRARYGLSASQFRRVACVAYDPLPVPGGLLPRRHLRPLSGIFPHVADREPLDLNSLLCLLLSHLECIRFRRTRRSFLMANCSPRYLTPQAWPQLARLAAPSALLHGSGEYAHITDKFPHLQK